MKERFENKKGFTLAELLIVVAIIAVLVAVSVPIFNSRLETAREATDIANMRAAQAAAVAAYLEEGGITSTGSTKYYYDAQNGKLLTAAESNTITPYGKGTTREGNTANKYGSYVASTDVKNKLIEVTIASDAKGDVTLTWINK